MRKLVSCFITIALLLFGMFQMAPTVSAITSSNYSTCAAIRFSASINNDANVFIISKKMLILVIFIILMINIILIILFMKIYKDNNKFIDFLNTELDCCKTIINRKDISINYLNSGITVLKEKNASLFSELSNLKKDNTIIMSEYESIAEKYNILKDRYKRIILLYPSADYEVTEMIKAEQTSIDAQDIQTGTQNRTIVEDTFENNSYDSTTITKTSKPTVLAVSDKSTLSVILCLNAIQNLDSNHEEQTVYHFDCKECKDADERKNDINPMIAKLEEKARMKRAENYEKRVLNCRNVSRHLIYRRNEQKTHA